MRNLLIGAGAAVALAMTVAPGAAEAAVTVCTGPGCVQPESNVLFDTDEVGTSVQGTLNDQPGVVVNFNGEESLSTTSSNGQARIEATDGGLTFLEIMLGAGQTFSEIEFNLNALADGFATLTFLGTGGNTILVTNPLTIGDNGQNFLGGFGDAFTGVQISTTVPLADVRQVRLGGIETAVPEPGTWAMMLLGFGAIGFTMRRRTAKLLQVA